MDIIDLRDNHDGDLLQQVYKDLYLACFTDPDEQEDLEQYRERLFDAQKPSPQPETHFLVAGERLSDPEMRAISGMLIFELYRESSCGLLTYLAVAPADRSRGLGRKLTRRAIEILSKECAETGGLRAVFAETHDPALIGPAADAMFPRDRIEVMKRLGARLVPVRYVQPELRPGDGRSRKLLLITFPIIPNEPRVVSGPALLGFLNEFYRALGVPTPPEDDDFQATKADVAAAETNNPRPEIVQVAGQLGLDLAPMASPLKSARPSSQSNGWILIGWWIFAIAWFVGFPYVVQFLSKLFPVVPSMKQIATWSRGDYQYFLVAHTADFVLTVFRGAVAFAILAWSYRTPLRFLIHSTFPDDERPQLSWSILWNPFAAFRRVVEMLFFYKNMLSLAAVRRFLYVATNPLFSRKVLNLHPGRVYEKLQVYFEAELFLRKNDNESRGAYGERVAAKYCENLKLLDRKGSLPVAICQTCFDVFGSNGKKIDRYFKAQVLVQRDPKFLTRIEFESGYLAPAYLVSGLLSEFDEDWTKIVNSYPEKMLRLTHTTDPLHTLPELRKLQSFIWDCWVQWGPSVPISGADAWRWGEVALQYGYGDENNSLPVRLDRAATNAATNAAAFRTDTPPGVWNGFRFDNWSEFITALLADGLEPTARAWPVKVRGHLRWLMSDERTEKFCAAQRTTKLVDDGWLVLDADEIEAEPDGPKFYSAYVWVLIAICDSRPPSASTSSTAEGPPLSPPYRLIEEDSKNLWRCLIPFFQHGNIAEPSVYESIKRELADKTITNLLVELARAEKEEINWLHFAFVASYDDNGDAGGSTTLVPPSSGTIRDYMEAALHSRTDHDPAAKALAARIHCAPDAFAQLAASELPHVVRAYLDHIEDLTTKK